MIKKPDLEISQFLKVSQCTFHWFLTKCYDRKKYSPEQIESYLIKINAVKSIDEQKVFLLTNFSLYASTIFKIDNEVKNFRVGLAAIKDNDTSKWGYIDIHFNLVIPAIYEEANDFNIFGNALVKQNGYWQMISKINKLILPCTLTKDDIKRSHTTAI